jgi:ABC-type uncharacterized transport system substrate-binding protein
MPSQRSRLAPPAPAVTARGLAVLGLAFMALLAGPALPTPASASADGGPQAVGAAQAASPEAAPNRPWRVIYVEAGPWRDFAMNLAGLARGLEELGIIEDGGAPPPAGDSALPTWRWLSERAGGDRLVFAADGFYSAGWDDELLPGLREEILGRLRSGGADLVLAMGTTASLMLATSEHSVPTLSITATDPVSAGITETAERSGLDHVHVQVEAGKIDRQLAMFHNLIGFRILGVPLDLTEDGALTMGSGAIERVALERGFEIITCRAGLELPQVDESVKNLIGCLEYLSARSEAVYLTVSNGMAEDRMADILAPMIARRLPTFSQKGPSETRLGVLMSLAEDDFLSSGRFEAEVVRDVLAGKRPGDIGQIYLPPLTMALNFEMATRIGWDPPFELLAAVDQIFVALGSAP